MVKELIKNNLCSACNLRSVFFARSYSGEKLCKNCFSDSIESKVKKTISKYKMFKFDDKIAVAVSGGKDSVSLLHILSKTQKNQPRSSLIAIIIDEGIQNYREEALEIAVSNCNKLKIDYKIVSFKNLYGLTLDEIISRRGENEKKSSCAFCGVFRRKAINYAARLVNADKIVTAHTLDDEVQTILLNIFHGDITRLSKGSPISEIVHPCFIQKVKPFCEILERESALYAYVKNIKFQDTPCPYSSEALRNDVRSMLNYMEEKHAGTKFTVFQTIKKIRPVLYQLNKKNSFGDCSNCGEPASLGLCKACEMLNRIK
jgi:uncharacterized protein (TIGR00269 family)